MRPHPQPHQKVVQGRSVRRCSVLMAGDSPGAVLRGKIPRIAPRFGASRDVAPMSDWKPRMQKAVRHLAEQLAGIRAGTLSVGFIETFRVSLHGNSVALGRMASVTGRGDRIVVTPFDPSHVSAVVKALSEAKLNAYAL